MMARAALAAVFIAAALAVSGAIAAAPDPLWAKTVASYDGLRKIVAQDLAVEVTETEGGKTDHIKDSLRLSGWKKGEPVYTSVNPDVSKRTEFNAGMGSFDKFTAGRVKIDAAVTRIDNQLMAGKPLTLFEMTKAKGGMKHALKIWVDPVTGVPLLSETKASMALMADLFIVIRYEQDHNLGLVETLTDMTVNSQIPFSSGKSRVLARPSNWITRPR